MKYEDLDLDPLVVGAIKRALDRMRAHEKATVTIPADSGDRLLVATDRGLVDVEVIYSPRQVAPGVLATPQANLAFSLTQWSLVTVGVTGKTSSHRVDAEEWTLRVSPGNLDINPRDGDRDGAWGDFLVAVFEGTKGNG
jgi:hypothetical protein